MEAARLAIAGDASLRGATAGVRLTVEHVATDAHARAGRSVRRREDAVRQVVDAEP